MQKGGCITAPSRMSEQNAASQSCVVMLSPWNQTVLLGSSRSSRSKPSGVGRSDRDRYGSIVGQSASRLQRWHLGVYLGQVSSSNESYVGTLNGGVIKTRSIAL